MTKTIEEQISKIFDCDLSYANKVIASLKINLPIQGATAKQMYEGYSVIHSLEKVDRLYEFVYCGMTEESSYATMSVHRTHKGAETAMNKHKEEQRIEHEQKMKRYIDSWKEEGNDDETIKILTDSFPPFGRFEDWGINETEVLE